MRVYAVSPQQYVERFKEGLARRDDLRLALELEKRGPGEGKKLALDRARRSQEELALIQRYPLISGFIDGPGTFGWRVSPRFRIADRSWYAGWLLGRYGTESAMEDGVRSVLAAIEVKTGDTEEARRKHRELKLRVTSYWESTSWHHRVGEETREMVVTLPGDPTKIFTGATPIHPSSGLGNEENVVTIQGEDFGTRAEVYIGSRKACAVKVLSRKFIEARLPKCYEGQGCIGKPLDVKVISHGDSYLRRGTVSFTYADPPAKKSSDSEPRLCEAERTPESVTKRSP